MADAGRCADLRMDTRTAIFAPSFSSLQIAPVGSPLAPPVITLGSSDRVEMKWDERSTDRRYLRYELIHCDADWRPSRLLVSEYLDGFNEATVDEPVLSAFSENLYHHYSITVPDGQMRPKVSGNYLIRVYDEEDPDRTLLQGRFYVVEPLADIASQVSSRTDVDVNDSHQQLSLGVETRRVPGLTDPFSQLLLAVQQDSREDNAVLLSRPLRVQGTYAVYEHLPSLIFPAGNEYRRFETVTPRYPGLGVESVRYISPFYHYNLFTDTPRADSQYLYDQTQHGRYVTRNSDATDGDTEADYGIVHFTLDMPRRPDVDIYIDGDLTLRRFSPESRMVYNPETSRYEASLLLKQGSYNYQYLALPAGTEGPALTSVVEGDKFETVNEYFVRVYFRPPGARADRLVGTTLIFSGT